MAESFLVLVPAAATLVGVDLQRQVTERALNIRHAQMNVLSETKELTRPANAFNCVPWHIQPAIRA